MSVFQVMLAGPSDIEKEIEAFYFAVDSACRLLRIVNKEVALLPLHWRINPIICDNDKNPQIAINNQLLTEANALIAVFRSRLGTPTERYSAGTIEEIELAIKELRIPILVCFFEGELRINDADQLKKLYEFKNEVNTRLVTYNYSSPMQLQSYIVEWLFGVFYKHTNVSMSNQHELATALSINYILSDPTYLQTSNVLFTFAGSKADAIHYILKSRDLETIIKNRQWNLRIIEDREIFELRNDYIYEHDPSIKWNQIPIFNSSNDSEFKNGYFLFDPNSKIAYLNFELKNQLEFLLLKIDKKILQNDGK